jgi:hypothetical protein
MFKNIFCILFLLPLFSVAQNSLPGQLIQFFQSNPDPETPVNALEEIFEEIPDVPSCAEGQIKSSEQEKVLTLINFIRSLHELKKVEYNHSGDIQTQKGAFICMVNNKLMHDPPESSKCWTSEGANGCQTSNLYGGVKSYWGTNYFISGWMQDNMVQSLGHRRWIIYPKLRYISYGFVTGIEMATSAALKVIWEDKYTNDELTGYNPDFVAFPYHDYPAVLVNKDWLLSLSVNDVNVNFDQAIVFVKDSVQNQNMQVTSVSADYDGFGIDNCLKWKVDNLENNTKYLVTIKYVDVGNVRKTIHYWFRLITH